jgi:hypothetical protein
LAGVDVSRCGPSLEIKSCRRRMLTRSFAAARSRCGPCAAWRAVLSFPSLPWRLRRLGRVDWPRLLRRSLVLRSLRSLRASASCWPAMHPRRARRSRRSCCGCLLAVRRGRGAEGCYPACRAMGRLGMAGGRPRPRLWCVDAPSPWIFLWGCRQHGGWRRSMRVQPAAPRSISLGTRRSIKKQGEVKSKSVDRIEFGSVRALWSARRRPCRILRPGMMRRMPRFPGSGVARMDAGSVATRRRSPERQPPQPPHQPRPLRRVVARIRCSFRSF